MFLEAYQDKCKTNTHLGRIPLVIVHCTRRSQDFLPCPQCCTLPVRLPGIELDTHEETLSLVPGTKNIILGSTYRKRTGFLEEKSALA